MSEHVISGLSDASALAPDRWLHPADTDPDAAARLLLFHHSGGNATMYRHWPAWLPRDVCAQAVQLPGRQERAAEPVFRRLGPLVAALLEVIGPDLDERPYALFGHSMGALLAYRVAVEVQAAGRPAPALLAVSGWAPEGFAAPTPPPGEELRALRRLGDALPPQLDDDQTALAAVARAMAADAAVCADYTDDHAAIGAPIAAYAGRDDRLLPPDAMRSWAARTPRYLGCRTFPGRHYYLREHAAAVAADVAGQLRRHAVRHAAGPRGL